MRPTSPATAYTPEIPAAEMKKAALGGDVR
jgi:hypothetical protein